jgi:hypothetical protein
MPATYRSGDRFREPDPMEQLRATIRDAVATDG